MSDALLEPVVEPVADVPQPELSPTRWRALVARLGAVPVEGWITWGIVAACVGLVVNEMGGHLLLRNTTPAGGDMGAHVWGPAYLRDELLTRGRLTGWTQDWYAGFPAYQFYMIVPSLLIALLSYVIPYGIAFKLVAVSGVVTMPITAWAFGRLTRVPFPGPALFAVAATAFLFDRSFSIYGGNIASTLAGEFAFSMSLSLALLYLGVLGRGLATGRHRGLAAVLLALVGLTHLIPAFFAIAATVVMVALHPGSTLRWRRAAHVGLGIGAGAAAVLAVAHVWPTAWLEVMDEPGGDPLVSGVALGVLWALMVGGLVAWVAMATGVGRWRWLATAMPVAGLLSAFWVLPFYGRSRYLNDMGWEKKEGCFYGTFLFDRGTTDPNCDLDSGLKDSLPLAWVLAIAAVGLLLSVLHHRRTGAFLAGTAAVAGLAFWLVPDGRLWNARLTPFYYLCLYLLAALGVAELGRLLAALVAPDVRRPLRAVRWVVAGAGTLTVLVALALPLHALPFGHLDDDEVTYRWGRLSTTDNAFVDAWAEWNFSGYEGKAAWPEYRDIVATMGRVGEEQGCGRAMWEHEEQHDRYGTPMALMLLPFWTSGCIGSMEGLYFEASTTTPYHFLNQDQLSQAPSNAQRDLPYGPGAPTEADFAMGVDHLQMLGVRYYLAISSAMQGFADAHPDLTEVATSGPWKVYEVAGSELVEGLSAQPAVVPSMAAGHKAWQDPAVCWYQDPEAWEVPLADDGPPEWQRIERTVVPAEDANPAQACAPGGWGWFGEAPAVQTLPEVEVTDIASTEDAISFRVDQVGVPVLVKASYFPNWKADGAEGPWRVTPNLMVVVPTEQEVRLHYGWTGLDLGAYALSLLGLIGLALLWRSGRLALPAASPFWAAGDRDRYSDREARRHPGHEVDGPPSPFAPVAGAVPEGPWTSAEARPPEGPWGPWPPTDAQPAQGPDVGSPGSGGPDPGAEG